MLDSKIMTIIVIKATMASLDQDVSPPIPVCISVAMAVIMCLE
jgi:hypothetical protein